MSTYTTYFYYVLFLHLTTCNNGMFYTNLQWSVYATESIARRVMITNFLSLLSKNYIESVDRSTIKKVGSLCRIRFF